MTITLNLKRGVELILVLFVLLLAAYLRLTNIGETPNWYTDEATHVDIAQHLAQGDVQYMVVTQSTLLFGRLPLFHMLLSGVYRLTAAADPFVTMRIVTALLGITSVGLLYIGLRREGGAGLGLLAAFALAVYPQAVLYNRFGFSYNLIAPLLLIMLLCLDRFLDMRHIGWLIAASLMLGLCLIGEVQALTFALVFGIILLKRWRWIPLAAIVALLPVLIYALWMLSTASEAFLFDLRFTLSRLGTTAPLDVQWATLTHNLNEIMARDAWVIPGLLGLFALPSRWRWMAILSVLLPIMSMGRVVALYQLSAYYLIPLLPFFALGVAALIWRGTQALYTAVYEHLPQMGIGRGLGTGAVAVSVMSFFLAVLLIPTIEPQFSSIHNGFQTEIDEFLISPKDTRAVAEFLNARLQPSDVTITEPALGWMLKGHPIDFQQAVALTDHIATPHLPADVDPARLAFNPDYRQARYVVIDHLWRQWGVVWIPGLADFVAAVERDWELVFTSGDFAVYHRRDV